MYEINSCVSSTRDAEDRKTTNVCINAIGSSLLLPASSMLPPLMRHLLKQFTIKFHLATLTSIENVFRVFGARFFRCHGKLCAGKATEQKNECEKIDVSM